MLWRGRTPRCPPDVHAPDRGADRSSAHGPRILLDGARQQTGTLQKTAVTLLRGLRGEEVATLLRQARDAETGERRHVFDQILKALAR